MTGLPIRRDDDVDGVSAWLSTRLYEFNEAATGHRDGNRLAFTVRGDDGDVLAGLSGWTWGGCGYVDVLWVSEELRGRGIGDRLLATAEAAAGEAGCDRMVLATHSFQAPDFYRARGYQVVGRVDGYPRGHAQLQLVKILDRPAD
jgi:ribosomal protein S18 acetylase RimI-like enzyme